MRLVPFWFIVITVLWTGFFVLEGFDFGVGMLHNGVGRDEAGRRAAINTIGPLWDGNEVWLIVAGAAMFAAFPGWYATMFSGLYLALVLLLAALMARGVSFEYRGKRDAVRWRRTWDVLLIAGSLLAPLLIGVALGDLLHGLPINSKQEYTGSFFDLLQPYALFTGVDPGADLPAVRRDVPDPEDHRRDVRAVQAAGPPRGPADRRGRRGLRDLDARDGQQHVLPQPGRVTGRARRAGRRLAGLRAARDGFAFAATAVTMAASIVSIFADLYPNVMVSSTNPAFNLTVRNTASGAYSLKVMTVVVILFLPFVLAYQTWTYYVFRRRVRRQDFVPSSPQGEESRPAKGAPPGGEVT